MKGSFYTAGGRKIDYVGEEMGRVRPSELRSKSDEKLAGSEFGDISLDELFSKLLGAYSGETLPDPARFDPENPTAGQCSITSVIVNDAFGAEIWKVTMPWGGSHHFNKINGEVVDLTSDQFSSKNIPVNYAAGEKVDRTEALSSEVKIRNYNRLKEKVLENL